MKRMAKTLVTALIMLSMSTGIHAGLYEWSVYNLSPYNIDLKLYGKFCGNILKHAFVDESPSKSIAHKQSVEFSSVGIKWGCCLGRARVALPGEGWQPVAFKMATSEQMEQIKEILDQMATNIETAGETVGKALQKVSPKAMAIIVGSTAAVATILKASTRLDQVSMCQSRDFVFVTAMETKKIGDVEIEWEQPYLIYTP